MLTLNTFAAFGDLPSVSPFCIKAIGLLQLAGVPWQRQDLATPGGMPYGQFPVLVDGAEMIADSEMIRRHLETRYNADFIAGLSQRDIAASHGVVRAMDSHFYFAVLADRWLDDDNWPLLRRVIFAAAPAPLRGLIASQVRRSIRQGLKFQGNGRYADALRLDRVGADLDMLEGLLDGQPFLFGDAPSAADCSAVAMLDSALSGPTTGAGLRSVIAVRPALLDYVTRGRAAFYPAADAIRPAA